MITDIDKNTALVLIDFQKGIVKAETAHPIAGIIEKAALLVRAFREVNLPIVAVNANPLGAAWTKARVEKPSVPGGSIVQGLAKAAASITGFSDLVAELGTEPRDIFITKKTWNAFCNTALHEELIKRRVTGIVLAGISTSIGVEGTARAASELGYNITFATDAMTDRVSDAHANSLKNIFPRIGEQGSVQDIIDKLPH